jgi:small subunit ribosomal protein S16
VLKIRLRRTGARKKPSYRIVVAESTAPRDGKYVEIIGTYDPLTDPATIKLDGDRAKHWLSVGAQPTERVVKLMAREGLVEAPTYATPAPKESDGTKAEAAPAATESPAEAAPVEAETPAEPAPTATAAPATLAEPPQPEAASAPTEAPAESTEAEPAATATPARKRTRAAKVDAAEATDAKEAVDAEEKAAAE